MKYHSKVVDFFKKHNLYEEKMFDYLQNQSTMVDYQNPDERIFIGCYYSLDKKSKLKKITLYLPYVYDEKTMLINIHEITHGIENYQKLGKRFKNNITIETLPLLYEKIYIQEANNEELTQYGKMLDKIILEKEKNEYVFGLRAREELIRNFNNEDIDKMSKKCKRLIRKYR